jgi:hypothetical protein
MKLGSLEIQDGWLDGDVQVYKFATSPDLSFVPKRFHYFFPGVDDYSQRNLVSEPHEPHHPRKTRKKTLTQEAPQE